MRVICTTYYFASYVIKRIIMSSFPPAIRRVTVEEFGPRRAMAAQKAAIACEFLSVSSHSRWQLIALAALRFCITSALLTVTINIPKTGKAEWRVRSNGRLRSAAVALVTGMGKR